MPLTSLRLLFVLGASATLGLVLSIRLLMRHRRLRAAAAGSVSLVLVLTGVAADVNRQFDLYRQWSDLFGVHSPDLVHVADIRGLARATATLVGASVAPKQGVLLDVTIPARSRGLPSGRSLVYLPPQYREAGWSHRTFPVVEAFHGSPGRPSDWVDGVSADAQLDKAINAGLLPPLIMVFPPTNTSFLRSLECTNTRDGLHDEDYLTSDVHDWTISHLRTGPARWTALGFSTGGYCALDLAVRHPELFGRVISLDGYGAALHDHYARNLWQGRTDRDAHSPDVWVTNHPPSGQSFYLAAGTHDHGAIHDLLATWTALGSGGWRTPSSALALEPRGHHTFSAWRRAFLPGLRWALGTGVVSPATSDAVERQFRSDGRRTTSSTTTSTTTPSPTRTPGISVPTPAPSGRP